MFVVANPGFSQIQTTFDRRYSFGPFLLPHLVLRGYFNWIFLKSEGCISGLFYENKVIRTSFPNLGIVDDVSPVMVSPKTPQYYYSPAPWIAAPSYLWLSVITLNRSEKVTLCRVGNRCTGLMIDYVEGPTQAFGQWHSSHISEHCCVYNKDKPSVSKVYFRMSQFERHNIVTDITFSTDGDDEMVLDSNTRVFDAQTVNLPDSLQVCQMLTLLSQPIAWWFSERYDEILPWAGQHLDIPPRSEVVQDAPFVDD